MLLFIVIAAVAIVLVAAATRPVSFTFSLVQTFSFLGLLFGLVGWFAVQPDPVFLWYLGGGGSVWLMATVLRSHITA